MTGIMLGILILQLFIWLELARQGNTYRETNIKFITIVNDTQRLLADSNRRCLDIMQRFFTNLEERAKQVPRLPGDEWKDLGEDNG